MIKAKELAEQRNLIYSLIAFGRIKTTRDKAKGIIGTIDQLVNKIKKDTNSTRQKINSLLPKKEPREKLSKEIVPKLSRRTSGYTRIIRLGERRGDQATIVMMEWVFDEETKGNAVTIPAKNEVTAEQGKNDQTNQGK